MGELLKERKRTHKKQCDINSQCTGKIRYSSKHDAIKRIKKLSRKRTKYYIADKRIAYYCAVCGGWHL